MNHLHTLMLAACLLLHASACTCDVGMASCGLNADLNATVPCPHGYISADPPNCVCDHGFVGCDWNSTLCDWLPVKDPCTIPDFDGGNYVANPDGSNDACQEGTVLSGGASCDVRCEARFVTGSGAGTYTCASDGSSLIVTADLVCAVPVDGGCGNIGGASLDCVTGATCYINTLEGWNSTCPDNSGEDDCKCKVTVTNNTCRLDICGDPGRECCTPNKEERSCLEEGYFISNRPGGWCDLFSYQCCPIGGTTDCDGVVGGNATMDVCDVCNGDGTSCLDCAGVANGGAKTDLCGECDGDGSSCGSPYVLNPNGATTCAEGVTLTEAQCRAAADFANLEFAPGTGGEPHSATNGPTTCILYDKPSNVAFYGIYFNTAPVGAYADDYHRLVCSLPVTTSEPTIEAAAGSPEMGLVAVAAALSALIL